MKVGLELRKKAVNKKIGILNIRTYNKGKRTYKSLGIELEFKYWDKVNQRVKSNYKDYKGLNDYLDTQLTNFKYNSLNPLKTINKTALEYLQSLLSNYKETTKENYTKSLRSFKKYLTYSNQITIELKDLNPTLFNDYKEYLLENNINNNTIFTHFAIIRSLINKAVDNNVINYSIHPFKGIKIKKIPPQKRYINDTEIKELIKYNNTNKPHLVRDKNIFIFQLFSQGMRITDVLLLKWNNFNIVDNQIKMEYVQSKRKKRIVLNVNPMMQSILENNIYNNPKDTTIINLNNQISIKNKELKRLEYIESIKGTTTTQINPIKPPFKPLIDLNNIEVVNNIDTKIKALKYSIDKLKAEVFQYKLSKMNSDNNVFFKNKIFNGFKSGNDLNKQQLKRINSIKGNINNNLKKVSKELNLTPLSTHIARHSYAMLSIKNDFSIDNISQALGHSDIRTTYNYIHSLPTNELNNKMNDLANKFI